MRSCSRVEWTSVDEWDGGFGWQTRERIPRTAHALLAGGRVWLIDPVDVPLSGVGDALVDLASGRIAGKVMVRPGGPA